MSRRVKFLLLAFLLLIFSTYTPNSQNKNKSYIFPIKKILIKNTKIINIEDLLKNLLFLKNKNILFIEEKKIESEIKKLDFVASFTIKKKYPDTLEIFIYEKEPVAVYIEDKKKFLITENGDKINYVESIQFEQLPLVFGRNIKFKSFFSNLKKLNFPINDIKSFQYFNIGRWDIVLKNEKIIKLPKENYQEILKEFILIYNDDDFKRYKIFDYRIEDQLILN